MFAHAPKKPWRSIQAALPHGHVARMKSTDYKCIWAGACHAIAMKIQDNEHTSQLESQGIFSAVVHAGTTCINKASVTAASDGMSGIPVSYSPNFHAQIYVAVDTRPCSLDLSRDDWWAMNPSYHTVRKDPNWVRKEHAQDPTERKKHDPTQRIRKKQDPA